MVSPDPETAQEMFSSNELAKLDGMGDTKTVMMTILARAQYLDNNRDELLEQPESLLPEEALSEQHREELILEQRGQVRIACRSAMHLM